MSLAAIILPSIKRREESCLWIQMNFYPNPDGPAPVSVLLLEDFYGNRNRY